MISEELEYDSVSVNSDEEARRNALASTKKRVECINNEEALTEKLETMKATYLKQFTKKKPRFAERLMVVASEDVQMLEGTNVNNDVQREVGFFNIALSNVKKGLKQIKQQGLMLDRPTDYYAEMLKSDFVMAKIRNSLVQQEVRIRNFEEQKMKKHSKKMHKQRRHQKNLEASKHKHQNNKAIENWKSDMKSKGGARTADLEEYIKVETSRREKRQKFQGSHKGKKIQKNRPGKLQRMKTKGRKMAGKR